MPQLSFHTPLGTVSVSEEDGAIVSLDWGWGRDQSETPLLLRARDQLQAYFDGEITAFDLPLAPFGSPYRRRVWAALCAIPYGRTRTYQEIAAAAGGSARSVGGASGPLYGTLFHHRAPYRGTGFPELDRAELSADFGWLWYAPSGRVWRVGLTEDIQRRDPGIDLVLKVSVGS